MMRIHYTAGKLNEAETVAGRITELAPDGTFGWQWRSRIEYDAHHLDAAERSAKRAVELQPSDTFSTGILARVAAKHSGCDAGLQIADAGLKQQPRHPYLRETRAELLCDANRYEEALVDIEAARQEAPRALSLRSRHLLILAKLGKKEGLVKEAQLLLADPKLEPATQSTVARALSFAGELEIALPVFARLAKERPDNFVSQNDYGYTLLKAGHPQEALPVLQQAVRLDPQDKIAWENLLNCATSLGRKDVQGQCVEELRKWRPQ